MSDRLRITSNQNPFYRHCLKLRDSRLRRRSGQFLIDGTTEIIRAIQAGLSIETLLTSDETPISDQLQALLNEKGISRHQFSPGLHAKLRYGQVRDQPVALAIQPNYSLESLQIDQQSLLLVLDQVEKPGNLGACLRTAVACSCTAVVLTRPICDVFNSNAIRASRGAIFQIPLAVTTPKMLIRMADDRRLPVYAARVGAAGTLWELSLTRGAILVFGNETHGLDEVWHDEHVEEFSIPMGEGVDSLNLAISASVTLFEAVRQKTAGII